MSDEITMGVSFANDEYLNYSVMRKITDFSGLEKGNIKKDYQKFMFNGKQGYNQIFQIFGGKGIEVERKGAIFNDLILENSEINTTSYNPKAFALCFEYGINVILQTNELIFSEKNMKKLVKLIYQLESGKKNIECESYIDLEELKEFLEKNGITSKNIIRYIHFLENFTKRN